MGYDFERAVGQKSAEQRQQEYEGKRREMYYDAIKWFASRLASSEMLPIAEADFLNPDAKTALRGLVRSNLAAGRTPEPIYRPVGFTRTERAPSGWRKLFHNQQADCVNGWLFSLGKRLTGMGSLNSQPVALTPEDRLGFTPITFSFAGDSLTVESHNSQAVSEYKTFDDDLERYHSLAKLLIPAEGLLGKIQDDDIPHPKLSQLVVDTVVEDLVAHNVPWVQPD